MKSNKITIFLLFILFLPNYLLSDISTIKSDIYFFKTKEVLTLEEAKNTKFKKLLNKHINYGFDSKSTIWLKVKLSNLSLEKKGISLVLDNPLLEDVFLYKKDNTLLKSGMLHIKDRIKTINPSFEIFLEAKEENTFYLKVSNKTTALQFSINIKDIDTFRTEDNYKQMLIVLFLGIITAFIVYSLILYIYTKNISYLFYCLYIFVLVFQQLTYVGFLPLHMSFEFTYIDNLIVVPKVGGVIIFAIIFARSFLKTSMYPKLDRVYLYLIYAVVLQILFLSTPWFYYPEVTVLTGFIFICFNMYAAIYVYKKGNKQARFFIIGWSFLIIGFFLSIIDALGLYSVMYHFPSLVLIFTSIEAMFLLLAFVDRLSILQEQKNIADKKLYSELEKRNLIIEEEVKSRTQLLNNLYKELHHRVKNNLQIMLSIIRLQSSKFDDSLLKEQFEKLENRIKSISKTHEILYLNDDIEKIDMHEYLYSLCEDIDMSFNNSNIEFEINSNVKMPLREAVYIGIVINELVSNSMKYAKNCDKITITLKEESEMFILTVSDNGEGHNKSNISSKTLGLKLVNNLVLDQLNGDIKIDSKNKCEYNIRFKI